MRMTAGLTYRLFFPLIFALIMRLKYNLFDFYTHKHFSTVNVWLSTLTVTL